MIEMMAAIICLALNPLAFPWLNCSPTPQALHGDPARSERNEKTWRSGPSRNGDTIIVICKGRDGRDGEAAQGKDGRSGDGGRGGDGIGGQGGKGGDGSSATANDRQCSLSEDNPGQR